LLVNLDGTLADSIAARWSQFVFSEDVQIANDSASTAEVGVYGPSAAHTVAEVVARGDVAGVGEMEEALRALPLNGNRMWALGAGKICVIASDDIGVRGFDVVVPVDIKTDIMAAFQRAGGVTVGAAAAEACRIEGGRPLFRVDMTEDTIPLEAGIEDRAISLTKGCYVGQEVIIRVLHRGHGRVARRLVGITFESSAGVSSPGDKIAADAREIGSITSAVESPALGRPIALGYVHRDFVQPSTVVTVNGKVGTVTQLPFVPIDSAVDPVVAE
jgi:folate-binding protein YgfZ